MARASRSAEDVGDGQGQHPGTPSSSSTAGSLAPEASLAVPPGGTQGALAPDSADLFLEVLKVIQGLGEDDRPEVSHSSPWRASPLALWLRQRSPFAPAGICFHSMC